MKQVHRKVFLKTHELQTDESDIRPNPVIIKKIKCSFCKIFTLIDEHRHNKIKINCRRI